MIDNKDNSVLYIFAILLIKGKILKINKENKNSKFVFMPFKSDNQITIDEDIWKSFHNDTIVLYYPNEQEYDLFLNNALNEKYKIIIALIDKNNIYIPGRDVVKLIEFKIPKGYRVIELGYDVTDLFGLSAIANIGYSQEEIASILTLNLSTTKYGLLTNKKDAVKFIEYANKHILEHAPFVALKLISLVPAK